ncbi:MAG TPA: CHASE3 domain-containing protein [Terriglobales bacterium]|nr:CHASE3 domain-containing protein [Terriglobales bacterium]
MAAVLLLIAIGVFALRAMNSLVASQRLVAHTLEVQTNLEDLRSSSLRANNSRRGYVLTGDEAMLAGYGAATQAIPQDFKRLRGLTADNPQRTTDFDELQSLMDRNLALLAQSIELLKNGNTNHQRQVEITQETSVFGTQIHEKLQKIRDDEARLLTHREAASQRVYKNTVEILAVAFAIALLLLAAEFYLLNLEFTRHKQTERIARQSREVVNAFFSSSTVGFAILDKQLRYRRINEILASMAGMSPADFLGRSVGEIFTGNALDAESAFLQVISAGTPILDREISGEMPGKPGEVRYWLVNYFPIAGENGQVNEIGVIAVDVTARRNAESAIRRLSGRLLNLQDQERRRIARELHDSLGQYLAGLKMTIELLGQPNTRDKAGLFSECSEILERCISETRTLSHLLHPPLLDEAGFASAAKWFVSGFSQRSGIPVKFELAPNFPRLPETVEIALFRVLQESLTNVHRHSQTGGAEIRVELRPQNVMLEVTDHGRGIPSNVLGPIRKNGMQSGMGLAGIRERVNELDGVLEIESNAGGTTIRVTLPTSGKNLIKV